MFDESIRRVMPRVLSAPARWLARVGVSPNIVSVSGAALGVASGVLVAREHVAIGIGLWLLSRVLDGLDGILARESGSASAFGGFLDITLDMTAYSAMLLGFAVIHPEGGMVWAVVLMGYLLVTTTTLALSSLIEKQNARVLPENNRSLQFTPGFAEAGETTAVYVLLAVFPGWTAAIAWGWAVLCFATVVQRTLLAKRLL